MAAVVTKAGWTWLRSGREFFRSALEAIDEARRTVCLETYIFAVGSPGDSFREALVRARRRGASVRVLVDAFGAYGLPSGFWTPLLEAGGDVRRFNPLSLSRLGIRDHRKLLVCDDRVAFVGGFNIAPEYQGDGVTSGWCDLGLRIEGSLTGELAESFDEMFDRADARQSLFVRFRKSEARRTVGAAQEELLLSGPGRGRSPIRRALERDLGSARSIQLMVAYFLPTGRLRRHLVRAARRGGHVRLLLAGKSDVAVSLLAARSLYRRLLTAGIEIYEYQPQVLHAKLFVLDDIVYAGSANLDPRSLNLNYELMIRCHNPALVAGARDLFNSTLAHCRRVTLEEWSGSRSFWERLKQRWAYWLLVRVDPYVSRWQWRGLAD